MFFLHQNIENSCEPDAWTGYVPIRTACRGIPAEVRGGIQNQIVLIQFHHLSIVKGSGYHNGAQLFFNIADDLGPHIGR